MFLIYFKGFINNCNVLCFSRFHGLQGLNAVIGGNYGESGVIRP